MADPLVQLFPQLATLDIESPETKFYTILFSLFFFLVIFILSYLASFTFHTFKNVLRTKEKVFWCMAFVRGVFGVSCTVVGFYYLALDDTLKRDVVNAKTTWSTLNIYYAVGFFLFECVALYTSNIVFGFFDKFLFIHHTLSLTGSFVTAYYVKAGYFAIIGMFLEFSTPFTCLCWMLLKVGLADTYLWKLNQIILVHLFHCRSVIEGYLVFVSYYQWNIIVTEMPGPLFWCLYTQLPIQLFFLTPYWTYKKTQQLMKPVDFNHPELQKQYHTSCNGDLPSKKDL